MVLAWKPDTRSVQQNRAPRNKAHTRSLYSRAKIIPWWRDRLFRKWYWENRTGQPHARKWNWITSLHMTRIISTRIKDEHTIQNRKTPRRKQAGRSLTLILTYGVCSEKSLLAKAKIHKCDCIRWRSLCTATETIHEMEKQLTAWEKTAHHLC